MPVRIGDRVRSPQFGTGTVMADAGLTVIVRFDHGIEACAADTLESLPDLRQALSRSSWDPALPVIARGQAEAIRSVNDAWGVFSRSRIALLPHQLWVCKRVQETWPTRWLVADDVGLGKTIEAGLILAPLLSRKLVRRFLIICPASLVDQWADRLWRLFDIRVTRYTTEADRPRTNFWDLHDQIVASLHTLRDNANGRHDRIFGSPPFDLVMVDEAHHLNVEEDGHITLSFALLQRLVEQRHATSLVFFTGTPHRGKDRAFLSLLSLLRPDLFDPGRDIADQLPSLRKVMIRNNKQSVTDLRGIRLFQQPMVTPVTYSYSDAEARFYQMLTGFIETGQAYASSLGAADGSAVMLVLTAMQKLASSSVAAIRRALHGRLNRIRESRKRYEELGEIKRRILRYHEVEGTEATDELASLEEEIVALAEELRLMQDEEPRLRQLVAAADAVGEETKFTEILRVLEDRFAGRQVLFFTEYKATQSQLISALIRQYGDGCATFINGDDRAEGVINASGQIVTLRETRAAAAARFNSGRCRFLVSTEAGGEGIDLHERCYSLIHVDLPWNPMRLHQRVGRLNRYGQTQQVEVVHFRNPDTVESRIWDKLNEKIASINEALRFGMEDPEDMFQLVLGMTRPSLFRELFAGAPSVPAEHLSSWFDSKTASFGGRDVLETVRNLVGHCERFDFQAVSADIPQVDLPALEPFVRTILALRGRRVQEDGDGLTFKPPEAWQDEPGILGSYRRMVFDRKAGGSDGANRLLGVGHRLFDKALREGLELPELCATVPRDALSEPLYVFRIRDRITGQSTAVRAAVAALKGRDPLVLLRDWELLLLLNDLAGKPGVHRPRRSQAAAPSGEVLAGLPRATETMERRVSELHLPFQLPEVEALLVIAPGE